MSLAEGCVCRDWLGNSHPGGQRGRDSAGWLPMSQGCRPSPLRGCPARAPRPAKSKAPAPGTKGAEVVRKEFFPYSPVGLWVQGQCWSAACNKGQGKRPTRLGSQQVTSACCIYSDFFYWFYFTSSICQAMHLVMYSIHSSQHPYEADTIMTPTCRWGHWGTRLVKQHAPHHKISKWPGQDSHTSLCSQPLHSAASSKRI